MVKIKGHALHGPLERLVKTFLMIQTMTNGLMVAMFRIHLK